MSCDSLIESVDQIWNGESGVGPHKAQPVSRFSRLVRELQPLCQQWCELGNLWPDFFGVLHAEEKPPRFRFGKPLPQCRDRLGRVRDGPVQGPQEFHPRDGAPAFETVMYRANESTSCRRPQLADGHLGAFT